MKGVKQTHAAAPVVDPLYVIFDQHLCSYSGEVHGKEHDRKQFVDLVLKDYLKFLQKNNITIPKSLELATLEELAKQIRSMLVKKTYGCLSIREFQKGLSPNVRRNAKLRYGKL